MFGRKKSKKNPKQKEYEALRKQAMEATRKGDIVGASELHARADEVLKLIESA